MPIFNPDSKFMVITNTILDYVKIGLLFMLFSIPVFTIGAAATAGMTVAMKIERGEAPVVWGPFWKAFRENFRQSTICTLVMLLIYGVFAFDWYQIMHMENSTVTKAASALIVILVLFFTMIDLCIFATIARYHLPMKAVVHNAVIYTILNFPKNLLAVTILLAGIVVYSFVPSIIPIVVFVVPALEFFYFGKVCTAIFHKLETKGEDSVEQEGR